MSDPNTTTITADTDDLDAFSDLFAGRVKEQQEEEVQEELPLEDDPLATEEAEPEDVDDPVEDDEEEDETLLKVKPKQTAKERIKELVAKNHETERREAAEREARLAIERRLEELEAKKAPEPKAKVATDIPDPEDVNDDGSPKYPLGEFDPTYIRDLTRHTIRTETEAAKEQERLAAQARADEDARTALQQNWASKLEGVDERLPDFREKAQSLESTFSRLDTTYAQYLASTIMSLDYGPDVLYYLSNNLDEAKRIASEGPTKATLSLGRIEARFANQEEEKPKRLKVSQAPTPPPAHTKGTKASREIPDDTDDLDAFSDKFFVKRR